MADPDLLRRFVRLNAAPQLDAGDDSSAGRAAARLAILEDAASLLADGEAALLRGLPARIGAAMGGFGWTWNGFYVLDAAGRLRLASAHGPPVCSELEASGGALTSGMCFDGLRMNQTLAAYDAHAWPGYVSCDATSQLQTASGLVSPVRDAQGQPIAVWDLDATERIEAGDVRFMDVLFASLARCAAFTPAHFEAAAASPAG